MSDHADRAVQHFQRAVLLWRQGKSDLTERELHRTLGFDPQHARAHGLLAMCLARRKEYEGATNEAGQAILSDPEDWWPHFAMARVLLARNCRKPARQSVREAIRLDPQNAVSFSTLATIEYEDGRWAEALDAAQQGLRVDPEDNECTNLRAMALIKLGRKQEAGATIDTALSRSPDDALTHANQGWALLEQGDQQRALEHFREALRLDPEMEWARAGMVTALKSRNFVYRILLGYFLWMSKLGPGARWGFIIGLYVVFRIVGSVSEAVPALAPFAFPLLALYLAFAALSWLGDPLLTVVLRLDRFGRHVLSREERRAAELVGACLAAAVVTLVAALVMQSVDIGIGALCFAMLPIPIASVFRCDDGWPRNVMCVCAIGLTMLTITGLAMEIADVDAGGGFLGIALFGTFASTWVANVLVSAEVRH